MTNAPAIFASAFHPHVGGVEELVRQLATEQSRRGLHPLVLTNRYPKSLPATERVGDVDVSRHAFRVPGAHWRHLAGWAAFAAPTHARVVRELRARRSDLVHVQCVSSNASYALSSSRALSLPLVVTMQGELTMDASQVYQHSAYLRRLWRRSLDAASAITGCSQYVLDEAEEAYGSSFGGRARVIYNGIRIEEYQDGGGIAGPPYLLGIGRMVREKGFDVLIDAFRELAAMWPDLRLVLAGDGPARPALEAQAAAAKIEDRIDFVGRVAHQHAVDLFRDAAVFVLPSRHEPQGIVVLEAMAARTPVIAAAVGGVPEIVRDGTNGLLFPGGDAEALAEAVSRALSDTGLNGRITAAGRLTAEGHDWAQTTEAYLEVYSEASS
jgi:glycosyltransferase involved in cell wall biosynthesis